MLNVELLRKSVGWSQTDMANYLGCKQSTVSRIEAGHSPSGPAGRLLAVLVTEIASGRIPIKERRRPRAHMHTRAQARPARAGGSR